MLYAASEVQEEIKVRSFRTAKYSGKVNYLQGVDHRVTYSTDVDWAGLWTPECDPDNPGPNAIEFRRSYLGDGPLESTSMRSGSIAKLCQS